MRKFILILIILLLFGQGYVAFGAPSKSTTVIPWESIGLKDKQSYLQESLFYAIYPSVEEEILQYYHKPVNYSDEKIISVSNVMNGYEFTIDFTTFIGPHLTLGHDRVVIKVTTSSGIQLIKFIHNE